MDTQRPLTITITPGTVVATVLVLLGFWLTWYLRDILLIVLTAVVFASAIEPATIRMIRWGFPRVLAVVVLYLLIFTALLAAFYLFVPTLASETKELAAQLPEYLNSLEMSPSDLLLSVQGEVSLVDQLAQLQEVLKASKSSVIGTATAIFGGLMQFILILVLSFYFAVQERGLDDFLRMITPVRKQEYILDLWKRAQRKIGRWLQGQLFLSLIVGVLVFIGLLVMGMPYALLLAIAAAILELIPVFGSILAAIPAVAVAFIVFGTGKALAVIVLYIVINQLQGNIIYPLVVQKVLGVSPLVVILAIIVGFQLAGFLGVLIAVPIAAAVQEYINDLQRGKQELAYPSEDGTVQ